MSNEFDDKQMFVNALREFLGLDPLYNKEEYEKRRKENLGMPIYSDPFADSKRMPSS